MPLPTIQADRLLLVPILPAHDHLAVAVVDEASFLFEEIYDDLENDLDRRVMETEVQVSASGQDHGHLRSFAGTTSAVEQSPRRERRQPSVVSTCSRQSNITTNNAASIEPKGFTNIA
jgi:hypothetical protein